MAALFALGCGIDSAGSVPKPTLAPTSVPPTFVRITVTPKPTETPTPRPEPTATIDPQSINRGPPEFPDWLDPNLTDERPKDEVIFEGWTKYLENTAIVRGGDDIPTHFCSNGVIMQGDGVHDALENWRIYRSPAIGSYDWGTVNVRVDIYSGRWEGNSWNMLTLVRNVGKVFFTNNLNHGELRIERSERCLSRL